MNAQQQRNVSIKHPSNYGNNHMQAETHAVRASLQEWSAHQESWEIRMWCNIIARHLDLLTREPHNLTLRQQTAAKVEQLRLVAVRVAKLNNCKGARTELAPPSRPPAAPRSGAYRPAAP